MLAPRTLPNGSDYVQGCKILEEIVLFRNPTFISELTSRRSPSDYGALLSTCYIEAGLTTIIYRLIFIHRSLISSRTTTLPASA
ncbi:hypothetical protein CPB83DRAFT_284721 [Crepidotus variabilis]|uniref:Uncharacterized protein n=1 Tax=Crepidotus variabilis TaxID=179855 RepID=A0A9P6EHQ0_9AGAR|nr:hypothetical protein CPB83DRAFT_284721 [Crepidotus variabilis]